MAIAAGSWARTVGTALAQQPDHRQRRRLAQVVGVLLEREPPDGDDAAVQPAEQLVGAGDEAATGLAG